MPLLVPSRVRANDALQAASRVVGADPRTRNSHLKATSTSSMSRDSQHSVSNVQPLSSNIEREEDKGNLEALHVCSLLGGFLAPAAR